MNPPPISLEGIESATRLALEGGHRILQTHYYGANDEDHVVKLHQYMRPNSEAIILDAGCGVGEVAKIMGGLRTDLHWILSNISPMQLEECPKGPQFQSILGDFHTIDLPDESVDVVMFNSSLCQMDHEIALSQAYRLLKKNGKIFINDMVHRSDFKAMDFPKELELLGCRIFRLKDLCGIVANNRFEMLHAETLYDFNDDHFRATLGPLGYALRYIYPVIVTAKKV